MLFQKPPPAVERRGFEQGLDGAKRFEHCVGNRRVHLHDGQSFHGLGAGALAAQREVGDVDALLAEDGADFADDAGDVEIAADEQVAFQRGLDVDGIELEQARLLAVNHCCAGAAGARGRVQFNGEHAGGSAAMGVGLFLVNADSALLRPQPRR